MFGGEFPGTSIIPRLTTLHIFVVPAAIAVLITIHMAVLIRQKHSHFPGPGRRNSNVVGSRMWPSYALRSLSLLFAVSAVAFFLGGLFQINPIWVWGEYEPWTILSPSVADWYILWVEGALRLFPPIEFTVFGFLVPNQFWPSVFMPGVLFGLLYLWPWIDRRLTGDRAVHHVAARPRESSLRVGIGVCALTFLLVLLVAGSEEVIAGWTDWTIGTVRTILRVTVLVLPPLAGGVAAWIAAVLRRTDRTSMLEIDRHDLVPEDRERTEAR